MLLVQSHPTTVSRRRVLSGVAALVILGATAATSAACGKTPSPPADLDDLTNALGRARADRELATEAADADKSAANALTEVAAERSAHAQAVAEEIVRMTGKAAPTTTTASSVPSAAPHPAATVGDVIAALRASAESAAQAAAALSGYRAGLLGSIAAACTASYSVALAPSEGTS